MRAALRPESNATLTFTSVERWTRKGTGTRAPPMWQIPNLPSQRIHLQGTGVRWCDVIRDAKELIEASAR